MYVCIYIPMLLVKLIVKIMSPHSIYSQLDFLKNKTKNPQIANYQKAIKTLKRNNIEPAKNHIKEKPKKKYPGSDTCQSPLTSRAGGSNQNECEKHYCKLSTGHSQY